MVPTRTSAIGKKQELSKDLGSHILNAYKNATSYKAISKWFQVPKSQSRASLTSICYSTWRNVLESTRWCPISQEKYYKRPTVTHTSQTRVFYRNRIADTAANIAQGGPLWMPAKEDSTFPKQAHKSSSRFWKSWPGWRSKFLGIRVMVISGIEGLFGERQVTFSTSKTRFQQSNTEAGV